MNLNLNAGGIIGGLALGAIVGAFAFSVIDQNESPRLASTLFIGGVTGGAFLGNAVWALIFKKEE